LPPDFRQLLTEHGALLARVAAGYEANEALRQELIQEISLAVWQALSGFKGQSSIKTYILRVAHNKAVTHVAYYARQPRRESYCELEGTAVASGKNTESIVSQRLKVEQLLAQIRQLPVKQRQVITLSMEGLSYEQIADITGLSAANTGVILNRVKKALTEKLSDV